MKLATWNVNSLKVRLPRVLEFIERHRPDVLCMQETKCEAAAFPALDFEAVGYHAVEHSAGRWAGVAIAAPLTTPLEETVRGLEGEAAVSEARYIEARAGDQRVASVYVPNGRALGTPQFADKLEFLEALARAAPRLDALAGDLNVTRADQDVYDPAAFVGETHVTPEERSRFEAILAAGLHDAFREMTPEGQGFTWWDYRQGHFHRGLGLRIDYVLLAQRLTARLASCGIDRDFRKGTKPSDHAPLIAELAD